MTPAPPFDTPEPPEREPFWGYGDLLVVIGLGIVSILAGAGSIAILIRTLHMHPLKAASVVAQQSLIYFLLFGSLAMLFRAQYDRPFWESLGWGPVERPVSLAFLGAGGAVLVNLLGLLIRVPVTRNPLIDLLLESRWSLPILAVFGIFIAPVAEELFFRGFLQPLFVRSLGAAPGIVAAALPFGLLHYQEYGNSWRHAVLIMVAGVLFGWVRHARGSTKASAIMHAGYNAIIFVAAAAAPMKDLPRAG
jgi:membrane protease YdiL (CAAX protease family)